MMKFVIFVSLCGLLNALTVQPYSSSGCCASSSYLYYVDTYQFVRAIQINGATGAAMSAPVTCGQFAFVSGIAVDSLGGLFVTDQLAANVYRIPPGCGTQAGWTPSYTTVVSRFSMPSMNMYPTAVTIYDGGLLVADSANRAVWWFALGSNYNAILPATNFGLSSSSVQNIAVAPDGRIFFIENTKNILVRSTNGQISTYLLGNQFGLPDIQDLDVSSCGLYFTVPDSNQVWRCTDLSNSASCYRDCQLAGIDSHSCQSLMSPYGLAVDCNCRFYSSSSYLVDAWCLTTTLFLVCPQLL